MQPGDKVQVRVVYNDSWSSGFEIDGVVEGGFSVRRASDGRLLPAPTGAGDVRPDVTELQGRTAW
jgi:hypothetical protein